MYKSVFAFGVLFLATSCIAQLPARPNIIVFMADDAGVGDIGAFGASTIRTPNIDQLAHEGMKFTQWYAPTGLCTPNRGSVMVGRLPIRVGLYSQYGYPLDQVFRVFYPSSIGGMPANETTIADALKTRGYYSALIGKWHQGHNGSLPTQRGFDYFFGTPYSHDEGYPGPFPMALIWPPVPLYENTRIIEQPIVMETITERMTDKAISIIESCHNTSTPFFLYVAYKEPHIPYFANEMFKGKSLRGRFGDMMEQMDYSIGMIMDKIESLGLDERTLVVFTSDNGAWPDAQEPFSATGENELTDGGSNGQFFEGKGGTWEGGLRVPTIFRWLGSIMAGVSSMAVTSMMDLFPTFLEVAGVEPENGKHIDGKSLVPLFSEPSASTQHEILFFWRELVLYAVRYGPWKAHYATRTGFGYEPPTWHDPMVLYHIEHDPSERFPVDLDTVPDVVDAILQLTQSHIDDLEIGPPLFDEGGIIPGQDWSLIPCCAHQDDPDFLVRLARQHSTSTSVLPTRPQLPELPEDWPLLVWENCLCPGEGQDYPTYTPPNATTYSFHGHPPSQFEKVLSYTLPHLRAFRSPDPRNRVYWPRN